MSKIALTKRVSITMRGFSILKQYCPGLAQGKAAYELINSIQPFISVCLLLDCKRNFITKKIQYNFAFYSRCNVTQLYLFSP